MSPRSDSGPAVAVALRVRYAETDQMGVAHHASHLVWFEVGRTEYCRAAGFSYADLERSAGVFLMVVEVRCRYRRGVSYDDPIRVETRALTCTPRLVRFAYRVLTADGLPVAEGETTHLPVGRNGKRAALPAPFLELLRRFGENPVPGAEHS
ncbi:MAG: acyl-CoA thioesterase [Acidobacteria bacterium]|nr:acyl-CoA thioesterase [Acidobacteriota bacterium]